MYKVCIFIYAVYSFTIFGDAHCGNKATRWNNEKLGILCGAAEWWVNMQIYECDVL